MKILRAYIDEPKPKSCEECDLYWKHYPAISVMCYLGADDYVHCPLIYAPSRSMQRRLDDQMKRGEQ